MFGRWEKGLVCLSTVEWFKLFLALLSVEFEFNILSGMLWLKPLGLYVTVAATFLNFYLVSAILIYRSCCCVDVVEFVFVSVPFLGEGSLTNLGGDLSILTWFILIGCSSFFSSLGALALGSINLDGWFFLYDFILAAWLTMDSSGVISSSSILEAANESSSLRLFIINNFPLTLSSFLGGAWLTFFFFIGVG